MIHLESRLVAEGMRRLLVTNGYDDVMVSGRPSANGFRPDVLLVDGSTVRQTPIAQCPDAKVLLMDTGIEPKKLLRILMVHPVQGILAPDTNLDLFRKAVTVVAGGGLWIDNDKVIAWLHKAKAVSEAGTISRIRDREKEIIELVRQGLSNKEIGQRLVLSEATVKTHLINIFRKLNMRKRSELITLTLQSQLARSV